jgi:hypothetical protein
MSNIWESTVDDNTWQVKVVDKGAYKGELQVIRVADQELVHSQPVAVSFDAIFGPDIGDVNLWAEIALQVIDSQI